MRVTASKIVTVAGAMGLLASVALPTTPFSKPAKADESASARAIEYSVLTPALERKFMVVTRVDALAIVSGNVNVARTQELRQLVAREHYSPSDNLASRIAEALTQAGLPAEVEEVSRGPDGTPNKLSRGDLPVHPKGRYLIDISIEYIGLIANDNFAKWEPMLWLRWRVFRPDGTVVVMSHRYVQGPGGDKSNGGEHRALNCGLGFFSSAMDNPGKVWQCFDLAFREAGVTLSTALPEALKGA